MASARTYAIDFGTSNTVVACWDGANDQPTTVALPGLSSTLMDNPPSIPSLVYIDQAQQAAVTVGQAVRDRGLDVASDPRLFQSFKRGIGASAQGFLPQIDQCSLTFEQVGSWFLQAVVTALPPGGCEELVLTVPVDSYEAYRHWLESACEPLSVSRVRLIDEPTAAALGYGLDPDTPVLVVDFGGGTLDLCLVQLAPPKTRSLGFLLKWKGKRDSARQAQKQAKTARVLAKAGDSLGGCDIDAWIMDYFAETQGLPQSTLAQRLCERLKIALSTAGEASEVLFDDETLETYELTLTREQFDQILERRGFFDSLENLVTQVIYQAQQQGVEPANLKTVLLVGGGAQIPALQSWLQQRFRTSVICDQKPMEAIAHGALQLAQVDLKDFLYHGYGLRYWNRRTKRHDWHLLIPQGQPYPMDEPIELVLGASVENQPGIELVLGEMGAAPAATEVYFDGDRLVTRSAGGGQAPVRPLIDTGQPLASLDPPGSPGSDRVRFEFYVDESRFLRVTAEDLLTNRLLLDQQVLVKLQ
ncbi:MAG: Hsp70 family protein [Elainellaceae cyanobacterium]